MVSTCDTKPQMAVLSVKTTLQCLNYSGMTIHSQKIENGCSIHWKHPNGPGGSLTSHEAKPVWNDLWWLWNLFQWIQNIKISKKSLFILQKWSKSPRFMTLIVICPITPRKAPPKLEELQLAPTKLAPAAEFRGSLVEPPSRLSVKFNVVELTVTCRIDGG